MLRRIPLTVAAVAAASLVVAPGARRRRPTDVTVMTRNVFLGADLPPIALAQPGADFEAAGGRGSSTRSPPATPTGRMTLIGDEIAKAKPDLVGLQEVSLCRTGPKGSPKPGDRPSCWRLPRADPQGARQARPRTTRVVAKDYGLNVEGPTDQGVRRAPVARRRRRSRARASRSCIRASASFEHQLAIPSPTLGDVSPARTWNALDATVRGASFHFVNTHLEAYSQSVRLAQAKELVKGPLKSKLPDRCSSATSTPARSSVRPGRPPAVRGDRQRRLQAAPQRTKLVLLRRPREATRAGTTTSTGS